MIITDKHNCRVQTIKKAPQAHTAPKSTFYADFKVCLALEGTARWEIGDKTYCVQPGDIFLLSPGQQRHFTDFGEAGFQLCAFVLTRSAFTAPHHFLFFLGRTRKQEYLIREARLSALLKEAYEAWITDAPFRYEMLSVKLTEFFIKAREGCPPDGTVLHEDLQMLRLLRYIDENISAGLRLRDVAELAGMSQSTFSRHFAKWNGLSFQHYLLEKKLQRAILLLQTTDLKIIDIATESGFDSLSGFYDAFQKKTGTTPRKFLEYDI